MSAETPRNCGGFRCRRPTAVPPRGRLPGRALTRGRQLTRAEAVEPITALVRAAAAQRQRTAPDDRRRFGELTSQPLDVGGGRPCERRGKHRVPARAESGCQEDSRKGRVPPEPVVRVELVQGVDGLPLAFVGCVRHRAFEHADEHEDRSRQEYTAEGDRAMAGVIACLFQSPLQPSPEEEEQERDQGGDQEADDLVSAMVVLPVREGLGGAGLAARVGPVEDEACEEQQASWHAGEQQEAIESVGGHLSRVLRRA